MQRGSEPGGRRPLVAGPLELTPEACPASEDAAERAAMWALDLLREDELALLEEHREDEIAFGRWLTTQVSQSRTVYDVLETSLPKLVRSLVRTRLGSADYTPRRRFTQVASIARTAELDRTALFDGWGPRGLLLIQLAHAYLVAVEDQPRLAALIFYSDTDFGGPEANAYGLHRVGSGLTVSRLAGLAGLGGDVVLPYSGLPYTVGLRCNPAHPDADADMLTKALKELKPFGFNAVPVSAADHIDYFLRIATAARGVVERAATGSRVCGRARVHPRVILERAFPRWLTIGPLPDGVHATAAPLPAATHMPGASVELLQTAVRHGMSPIFTLFDTVDLAASHRGLQDVVFSDGANEYSGRQFAEFACSPGRREIPGLRGETAPVLRSLGDLPELGELGVKIDPQQVDWLWCARGVRLLDGCGRGTTVGLLMRASARRTTGYAVMCDLENSEMRAHAIARADLHFLSTQDPTCSNCVGRVFDEYELHTIKSWKFDTRSWLRLGVLLSNCPVVGVGRRLQAARGARH